MICRAWSVNRNFLVSLKTKIPKEGKLWFANFTRTASSDLQKDKFDPQITNSQIANLNPGTTAKNYSPVLSVVSKVFEKLVNNKIVDHLEKCGLFSNFLYGFWCSWSNADLLTVVSDRYARAFNRSGATQAVALDISKAFDRVWQAGLSSQT